MSGKTTGKVWDLDLPRPQQIVLLALADRADHNDENISPGAALVAWMTGYSVVHVRRIMKQLVANGLLVVTSTTPGKETTYRIDVSKGTPKPKYQPRKRDGYPHHNDDTRITAKIPLSLPPSEKNTTLIMPSLKKSRNGIDGSSGKDKVLKSTPEHHTHEPNPMYDAVQQVWGYVKAMNHDMQMMLLGTATKAAWKEYNLDTPITPDELLEWAAWYRREILHNNPDLNMVQQRGKVQNSIMQWQAKRARLKAEADAIRATNAMLAAQAGASS